jgi:hypothetical protein
MHIVAKRKGIKKERIFYAIMIGASISNAAVLAESTRALASEFPGEKDEEENCGYDSNCEICDISRATLK